MLGARILADMGAAVIRIEKPGAPETAPGPDFACLNAGKRRISLDIETEKGRDLFRRLVKTADILVETAPPGYLASLGLDYAQLSAISPGLVMASVTDFGQGGPYRDLKSSDLVAEALGGWLSVTGGLFAVNGILLALWQRHATGRGQYIDVSVMECVAATLDHALVRYFYEDTVSPRRGSLHWNNAFRVFPCRDGYILLSLFQQWETLVAWLDSEGMAAGLTDDKWRDREERTRGIDHIIGVLERWTLSHTVGELVERGQLMRFPWARVASIPELLSSPQLAGRQYFTGVEYQGVKYSLAGAPVKMGASPWRVGGRVPDSGEHNLEIYRDELGLSSGEMAELTEIGVI